MKFIEIVMPRNASDPGLPENVLINLDGIQEVYVRALRSKEIDVRGHEYGLFIAHRSREMRLHGTKPECDQGYKDLRALLKLDTEQEGIVGRFTFPNDIPF